MAISFLYYRSIQWQKGNAMLGFFVGFKNTVCGKASLYCSENFSVYFCYIFQSHFKVLEYVKEGKIFHFGRGGGNYFPCYITYLCKLDILHFVKDIIWLQKAYIYFLIKVIAVSSRFFFIWKLGENEI